jgi:hypothetical protein
VNEERKKKFNVFLVADSHQWKQARTERMRGLRGNSGLIVLGIGLNKNITRPSRKNGLRFGLFPKRRPEISRITLHRCVILHSVDRLLLQIRAR